MTVKGFEDPDILAHLATMGRYINRAEDYICRSEHFQEPFSATGKLFVCEFKVLISFSDFVKKK